MSINYKSFINDIKKGVNNTKVQQAINKGIEGYYNFKTKGNTRAMILNAANQKSKKKYGENFLAEADTYKERDNYVKKMNENKNKRWGNELKTLRKRLRNAKKTNRPALHKLERLTERKPKLHKIKKITKRISKK